VDDRWSRRRFLRTAGAGGLGLLSLPALGAARTRPRTRPAVQPSTTNWARFGAFSEPVAPETSYVGSLKVFESAIGRQVAVYRTYRDWGQPIINSTVTSLLARKTPPRLYISVHAFYQSKGRSDVQWADIAAGKYNAQIDSWSTELKTVTATTPVYMCFHHEMENELGKCGTTADFQNAYWFFRNRVAVVNKVPNLTWVVTYMGNTFRGKHGGPGVWWPGKSQFGLPVDQLMGVDLYNRGLCHYKGWRTFDWLAAPAYQFAQQQKRPMFIGECGCVEGNACGGTGTLGVDKQNWLLDALTYMRDTAPSLGYGPLEAFCYSNVLGFNNGSYRIDSSPQATKGMTTLASDPFFAEPA